MCRFFFVTIRVRLIFRVGDKRSKWYIETFNAGNEHSTYSKMLASFTMGSSPGKYKRPRKIDQEIDKPYKQIIVSILGL